MFVGRERELETLNKLFNSERFEFVVMYGRRRIGKTALINKFLESRPAVYFTGVESSEKQNLENFSRSIFEYSSFNADGLSFSSFQEALEHVFKMSENKRLILAIDEYPYAAASSKSLASTLQLLIDKYREKSKLMLILCGSSMSYMEKEVLSYKAPLYGRRTAQMKILPFDFFSARLMLNGKTTEEQALFYGMLGGTPQYLLQTEASLSVEENIKNIFLNPSSFIFEEPQNLLKQEVREPAVYNAVISAVASGASKMSEISTKVGEQSNVCTVYLKNLVDLGIVQKEMPYGEKMSRKAIYRLADNMFRFWYRFIPDNSSMILRGGVELAYSRIAPQLSSYMGQVFEEICRQYLWRKLLEGKMPVVFNSLGRWWGNDPVKHEQAEIDIMGEENRDNAIFCECKWENEKTGADVLQTLFERSQLFAHKQKHYYLFSKKGFTAGCVKAAKELGSVSLIKYSDMVK